MSSRDDTIVAISSPPGRSWRGLIRLSGAASTEILRRSLTSSDLPEPRRLTPSRLRLPTSELASDLPVLITHFAAPRSYTGQDLVEIQCPGHPALLDRLVQHCIKLGARLAEPGEFTLRAFLSGKLDLTRAEGVAATIAAESDTQLHAAKLLRDGELARLSERLVDQLATLLALVEAGIDFTDQDDVTPISPAQLHANLHDIEHELAHLLANSRRWGAIEALPRVVLVGLPSAGKSTLFNALLNRQRAVVSPMPGTTRDILAEPMRLRDDAGQTVEVMLVDIAGLDDPRDALDTQVQAAARRAIAAADLILRLDDGRGPLPIPGDSAETNPVRVPVLHVRSKSDELHASASPVEQDVLVSAITGQGMDDLRRAMVKHLGQRAVSVQGQLLTLQPRHESALRSALDQIRHAEELLEPQRARKAIQQVELVAGALRAALDELAGLGGQMTPDDIIGRVFATFCIGK